MWKPKLDDRPGPKYIRIADALAEDIYAGRLGVGERLPTHRELAWSLGVTVGTVSRAYAEAERRGLLVGEVGRGSYVRAGARSASMMAMPAIASPQSIELGISRPPEGVAEAAFAEAVGELAVSPDLAALVNYQSHTGKWEHRVAGARWIGERGLETVPDRVLVTSGAQHAVASALMALCDPGDPVLVESVTWSGTRALANMMRLSLRAVELDSDGLVPEALEAACRTTGARVLYLTPEIQNPTSAVLPADRRRAIADIARRYDLTIVEDDIYGMLPAAARPPVAVFAPERTIYITGSSKVLAPALRIGFASVPRDRLGRFAAAARATNWMAPPVMAEIVRRWIDDGTALDLTQRTRTEVARRHAVAHRMLAGFDVQLAPGSFFAWMSLPDPWRSQELVTAMARRGVSLTATELFVPGREETPPAVRVALTGARDLRELEDGLGLLVETLRESPEPFLAVA